mgnify:CR=1 FL=1
MGTWDRARVAAAAGAGALLLGACSTLSPWSALGAASTRPARASAPASASAIA